MRKALGVLMIAIGLSGIVFSIGGVIVGRQLVDAVGQSVDANLALTLNSLDTVHETLLLTKNTVSDLDSTMTTVEETAAHVATALKETEPLVDQSRIVVTEDVPDSIEAIQQAMPALTDVAGAVDSTLRTLSAVQLNRSILGIPLNFDLGIDYNPDTTFDESLMQIADSLEGVPENLRSLDGYLEITGRNLQAIASDLDRISGDVNTIGSTIGEVEPLIDDYLVIVTELSDSTRQTRTLLARQLSNMSVVVTALFVWFALAQIAPLYLGYELLSGSRGEKQWVMTSDAVALEDDQDISSEEG
jgi:uncharacterized protein YoxC